MIRIVPMYLICLTYLRRRYLAVLARKRQYLMPRRLDRSCLMDINMACRRCDRSLIRADRADHRKISLSSAHEKVYVNIRAAAQLLDLLSRTVAERVIPIPRRLFKISLFHPL